VRLPKGARNLTLQLKRHADFVFGTAYYPEKVAREWLAVVISRFERWLFKGSV
jgi:hypothetical protein